MKRTYPLRHITMVLGQVMVLRLGRRLVGGERLGRGYILGWMLSGLLVDGGAASLYLFEAI